MQAQGVEHLAGGEEADHHVPLGLGEAVHHSLVHGLEQHFIGLGGPLRGELVFQSVGLKPRRQELAGFFGLGFGQSADLGAKGFDEIPRSSSLLFLM